MVKYIDVVPTVINKNGNDYASCPKCAHYNAMMPLNRTEVSQLPINGEQVVLNRINAKCRDCGLLGEVVSGSNSQKVIAKINRTLHSFSNPIDINSSLEMAQYRLSDMREDAVRVLEAIDTAIAILRSEKQ